MRTHLRLHQLLAVTEDLGERADRDVLRRRILGRQLDDGFLERPLEGHRVAADLVDDLPQE
jgi:hypothetical protein